MKYDYIICHYDEIGIKGKNRAFFEKKLRDNIREKLKKNCPESFEFVKRIQGRILVKLTEKQNKKNLTETLKNIPGISYFAFVIAANQNLDDIKKSALFLLSKKKFKTFKIETQRSNKSFPLTSQEASQKIGEYIVKRLKTKVNLKRPGAVCFIEIVENFAFLYTQKIKGIGGLPVGSSGRLISLLSGGIDSPVASFYIMKRGAEVIFVHFHSLPYTSPASVEKAKELIKTLNKYQNKSKLYLVPFAEIQKEIMKKAPEKLRVILYRRLMMKIAEKIAKKENTLGIITGEALGQVASQTLENMLVVQEAVKIPVYRPLIGFDKKEIVNKAKELGTYKISILPHEDCCSLFIPKKPETKAKLEEVKKVEKNLNIKKLITEAIKKAEIFSA